MGEARKQHWSDDVAANAHQFTATNGEHIKYVSLDGRKEVVYDSSGVKIVTAPEDV